MSDKTETVQKLLAKAERAGSEHEAEAFRATATELMMRYSIDESVLSAKHESTDVIGSRTITVTGGYAKSYIVLLNEISGAFGVQLIRMSTGSESVVKLYGWESDLAMVEVLYASLQIQAMREAKMSHRRNRHVNGRTWTVSFMIGFTVSVRDRLKAQRAQAVADTGNATGTALALVDRSKAVERFFRSEHTRTRNTGVKARPTGGFGSGKDAGNRADIGNTRIGGSHLALAR
jgi:hypothetical protein